MTDLAAKLLRAAEGPRSGRLCLARSNSSPCLGACHSRVEAERALGALRAILAGHGLTLKEAKTRIVELREGGEGLDFLGFHHRWVRGNTPASRGSGSNGAEMGVKR